VSLGVERTEDSSVIELELELAEDSYRTLSAFRVRGR
jgi:hypothetical protein